MNVPIKKSKINEKEWISIIFMLNNKEKIYSLPCKKTDKFSDIEKLLYEEFPEYNKPGNVFTVNGRKINKNKTIKENEIKNSDKISLS